MIFFFAETQFLMCMKFRSIHVESVSPPSAIAYLQAYYGKATFPLESDM